MGGGGLLWRPGEGIAQIQEEWTNPQTVGECQLEMREGTGSWGNATKSQTWRRVNSPNDEEREKGGDVHDWKRRIRVGLTPGESEGRERGVFGAQVTRQLSLLLRR